MSVLIKGMYMPTACEWCRFISGGLEWYCEAGQIQIYDYKTIHKDCPLVKVPTHHGRLIDADELSIDVLKTMNRETDDTVIGLIDRAPTIIEAEQDNG